MREKEQRMTRYAIERYLNVQAAYGATAIDNHTFAFLSNMTGTPEAYTSGIDPDGKILWAHQLTFEQDRVMGLYASPVADDPRLIYGRDVGGNEQQQFILLNTQTRDERLLTDGHTDAMHLAGSWSADGKLFSYGGNRRDKSLFDLFVQDVNGESRQVYQNDTPGYLWQSKFSPDNARLLVMHMMGSFDTQLLEVDIDSQEGRILTTGTGVRYFDATYLSDGEHALIRTDKDRDFIYMAVLNIESGAIEPLIVPDWNVSELCLSPNKAKVAYTVNEDGITKLYLYHLESGDTQPAPDLESPGAAGGLSFTPDSERVLYTGTLSTRTTNVYLWDTTDNTTRPVTAASHAGIPPETFVAPALIRYPTFDDDETGTTRQIPSWVYKPDATTDSDPLPVIVMVHGGPEGQALPNFNGLIQYFVNNGYAVMQPNVRGSVGYGKAYSHLDDVRKRMDSVADLAHIVEYIKADADLDASRVAVYGGSYGGFMVLSAITTYPDLWQAAVNIVGISNFVTFLENTSDYRRAHREAEYGSLEHDREFLESISPSNHLDNVTAPLFVIHGANDPRVPLSEAEQLVAALDDHDVPVELLVFEDEGHGLAKLKNRLVAYARVVEFLDTYL
jgi:dipeptidyl aminopeptidase/acylaminoacyl peptidase